MDEIKLAAQRLLDDFPSFCANAFNIIDKNGTIRLLEFNNIQNQIWSKVDEQIKKAIPVRIVVLKPRQVGVSTFFCAFMLWLLLKKTVKGVQVAHKDDATQEVYGIIRFATEHLPEWFMKAIGLNLKKCDIDGKGITLANNYSVLQTYTAAGKEIGRSGTKQAVHLTEVAFYPDAEGVTKSLFASFPETPNTVVIQESTGNGPLGYFHDLFEGAMNGKNAYLPLFYPWYAHEEYSMDVPEGTEIVVPDNIRPLYESGEITREQLYWRQYSIANKYNGNEEAFLKEYPSTIKEAWFQDAANFFPFTAVMKRIDEVKDIPFDQGDIAQAGDHIELVPLPTGGLRIFKYPEAGHYYVIGADPSSGVATSSSKPDMSSANILEAKTGDQVAHLNSLIDPLGLANRLYLLGHYYNDALISVEANDGHGQAALNYLRDMGYPLLYQRRVYDQANMQWINKLGWSTTGKTRQIMLDHLRSAFLTGAIIVNDPRTLSEMLAFVKSETTGKIQAIKGAHDDCVMALAIVNMAREEYKEILCPATQTKEQQVKDEPDDFLHSVRKKHLLKDQYLHPELGPYY